MKKYLFDRLKDFFLLNVITKCDHLLLSDFIQCLESKEYSVLKKHKFFVPKIYLEYAWSMVFEEYCIISNNTGYEEFYSIMKKLYQLDSKILAIQNAVRTLVHEYDKKCVDLLCKYGYNFNFYFENKKEYYDDLNNVLLKNKSAIIERERAKAKYETLSIGQKTIESVSRYFRSVLIPLSKYMGYRLDPRKITVSEFAAIASQYEKEITSLMNKR